MTRLPVVAGHLLQVVAFVTTATNGRFSCLAPAGRFSSVTAERFNGRHAVPNAGFPRSSNRRCRGSTISSAHMMERFFQLLRSNVGALLRRYEDPEKTLDLAMADMQNDLRRARIAFAGVLAAQQDVAAQTDSAERDASAWRQRAETAVKQGREELAREALRKSLSLQKTVRFFEDQLRTQGEAMGKLRTSMAALESKIADAKSKKMHLLARARMAKTHQKMLRFLGDLYPDRSGIQTFERMEKKIRALENEVEAEQHLQALDASLEQRFESLERGDEVEKEFEEMKRRVTGTKEGRSRESRDSNELQPLRWKNSGSCG